MFVLEGIYVFPSLSLSLSIPSRIISYLIIFLRKYVDRDRYVVCK